VFINDNPFRDIAEVKGMNDLWKGGSSGGYSTDSRQEIVV